MKRIIKNLGDAPLLVSLFEDDTHTTTKYRRVMTGEEFTGYIFRVTIEGPERVHWIVEDAQRQ